MINLGQYNELVVGRLTDFGAYLRPSGDTLDTEVLLPRKFFPDDRELEPGSTINVFVYADSEDRPIATTERPYATAGQYAYMQVMDVNDVGAFLDWGLESKQLLVPYSEQMVRMRRGMQYLVYVYVDEATNRIVASARVDRFLERGRPVVKMGDEVQALVFQHVERLGYKCIVNNRWKGIIYESELFEPLPVGETVHACVKYVRDDNKIDLTYGQRVEHRLADVADRLLQLLSDHPDGSLRLTDRSPAEDIKACMGCSKKDFKRAVGQLFKQRKIALEADRIVLIRK